MVLLFGGSDLKKEASTYLALIGILIDRKEFFMLLEGIIPKKIQVRFKAD
jgi:hypothetical protein